MNPAAEDLVDAMYAAQVAGVERKVVVALADYALRVAEGIPFRDVCDQCHEYVRGRVSEMTTAGTGFRGPSEYSDPNRYTLEFKCSTGHVRYAVVQVKPYLPEGA